jgi:hypothetical protein
MPKLRKLQMELGLHEARFLKNTKITHLSSKKFGTKNLVVEKYEINYSAKKHSEIHSILGSAKKTNV